MGFNYAETHLTALFAKFDEDCSGEIDYNEFIRHIEKV